MARIPHKQRADKLAAFEGSFVSLPWCYRFTGSIKCEIFVKLHQNFAERLKFFSIKQDL